MLRPVPTQKGAVLQCGAGTGAVRNIVLEEKTVIKWWRFPTVTQDEGCFPSCSSPDGRASLHKALPGVINGVGGADVRCSANFVEGKGSGDDVQTPVTKKERGLPKEINQIFLY